MNSDDGGIEFLHVDEGENPLYPVAEIGSQKSWVTSLQSSQIYRERLDDVLVEVDLLSCGGHGAVERVMVVQIFLLDYLPELGLCRKTAIGSLSIQRR